MAVNNSFNKKIKDALKNYDKINQNFDKVEDEFILTKKSSKIESLDYEIEEKLSPYDNLLLKIVNNSFRHLEMSYNENETNRRSFRRFFLWLLAIQFILIGGLVFLKGIGIINLSDTLIHILVVSVFVETLGVVTIMVTFVFNSKTELGIINAIQKVAEHYKK